MPHAARLLVEALSDVVGPSHVVVAPDVVASYCVDWTGRFRGTTTCVVRPASADEGAAVLGACGSFGAAVVPQGGNTGLVGGGVPRGGEVVLSLGRLDWLGAGDAGALHAPGGGGAAAAG